jgi:hypothetical protein
VCHCRSNFCHGGAEGYQFAFGAFNSMETTCATGLAQCYELVHQLRGTADARQVDGARLALQHNLGLGGAAVVTLYEKS